MRINNFWRDNQVSSKLISEVDKGEIQLDQDNEINEDRDLLRIHVYFQDLNFESIEEEEDYKWEDLLADVGGVLGNDKMKHKFWSFFQNFKAYTSGCQFALCVSWCNFWSQLAPISVAQKGGGQQLKGVKVYDPAPDPQNQSRATLLEIININVFSFAASELMQVHHKNLRKTLIKFYNYCKLKVF